MLFLLFFLLNGLGFIVALFFWNRLSKPAPYDYTTIPGMKLDRDPPLPIRLQPGKRVALSERGNIEFILKEGSFERFLDTLHLTFGPLACFWWGQRYVISIRDYQLSSGLRKYRQIIRRVPAAALTQVFLGHTNCWTCEEDSATEIQELAWMKRDEQDKALVEGPTVTTADIVNEKECNLIKSSAREIKSNHYRRPVVVVFNAEIDVDAHPIPAHIPIIITLTEKLEFYDWIPGMET